MLVKIFFITLNYFWNLCFNKINGKGRSLRWLDDFGILSREGNTWRKLVGSKWPVRYRRRHAAWRSPLVRGALLAWKRCACVRRHASPVQQPWLYLISCRELFNLKLRVPRSNRIVCNTVYFFRGGIFSPIIGRIELSTEPDDKTFVLSRVCK